MLMGISGDVEPRRNIKNGRRISVKYQPSPANFFFFPNARKDASPAP